MAVMLVTLVAAVMPVPPLGVAPTPSCSPSSTRPRTRHLSGLSELSRLLPLPLVLPFVAPPAEAPRGACHGCHACHACCRCHASASLGRRADASVLAFVDPPAHAPHVMIVRVVTLVAAAARAAIRGPAR